MKDTRSVWEKGFVQFFLLFCIFMVITEGCGLPKAKGRYVSERYRYSIEFPEGWEMIVEDGGSSVIAISPPENDFDSFDEALSVLVFEGIGNVSLEDFYEDGVEVYHESYENFSIVDEGTIQIDNHNAMWIVFSYDLPDIAVRVLEYSLVKDGKGYVITADAEDTKYERYIDIFERASEGFRFE
jgi:hypothetical protein